MKSFACCLLLLLPVYGFCQQHLDRPQLSLQRTGKASEARFQVTLRNPTATDLLLNVGLVAGQIDVLTCIRYLLKDGSGKTLMLEPTRGTVGIAPGRSDPMLLPLPKGATFAFPIDLSEYYAPSANVWRLFLTPGRYTLQAEYEAQPVQNFVAYGVAAWRGSSKSNVVSFTLRPRRAAARSFAPDGAKP